MKIRPIEYVIAFLAIIFLFPLYASVASDYWVYNYGELRKEVNIEAEMKVFKFTKGPRDQLIITFRLKDTKYSPISIYLDYADRDTRRREANLLGKRMFVEVIYKENKCKICYYSARIIPINIRSPQGNLILDEHGAKKYFEYTSGDQWFLLVTFTLAILMILAGFHFQKYLR